MNTATATNPTFVTGTIARIQAGRSLIEAMVDEYFAGKYDGLLPIGEDFAAMALAAK